MRFLTEIFSMVNWFSSRCTAVLSPRVSVIPSLGTKRQFRAVVGYRPHSHIPGPIFIFLPSALTQLVCNLSDVI